MRYTRQPNSQQDPGQRWDQRAELGQVSDGTTITDEHPRRVTTRTNPAGLYVWQTPQKVVTRSRHLKLRKQSLPQRNVLLGNNSQKSDAFGGNRTHALKEDYDLNVAP